MDLSTNGSNYTKDGTSTCVNSQVGLFIFTSFAVTNIVFIPLFVLILYMGWLQWRKQRSGSSATHTSHSDAFTYNVIILELISLLACVLYCSGAYLKIRSLITAAQGIFSFTSPGQSLFHVLTCVERYVAVVHPITYRSQRNSNGVRIRNISSGCVWLFCLAALAGNKVLDADTYFILQTCALVAFLALLTFCSVSVLCILIQDGPRKGAYEKASFDQSKRRAFHTITAIMGALWLRFLGVLFTTFLTDPRQAYSRCKIQSTAAWLTLPGSLVLPLLFLHRAGKLTSCKHPSESEWEFVKRITQLLKLLITQYICVHI